MSKIVNKQQMLDCLSHLENRINDFIAELQERDETDMKYTANEINSLSMKLIDLIDDNKYL